MGHQSHHHALINRGRKAGLTTRELYSAMATLPPEGGERSPGQSDCNGYVSTVNSEGHAVYRPAGGQRS
jgi:hypothetical protein